LQDFPRIQFRMAISDPAAVPYNALPPRLRGRITFTPLVFGPRGFTGDIDLFVNTARRDPAHVTLTDALAAGIPAIATTASGSSELATMETRIQLYRAGDDDALGAAIARAYLRSHSDDGGGSKPRSTIDDAAARRCDRARSYLGSAHALVAESSLVDFVSRAAGAPGPEAIETANSRRSDCIYRNRARHPYMHTFTEAFILQS